MEGNRYRVLALAAPVAMGYIPLGAVFGFLFVQAGGQAWMAVMASVVVYAGASQFMMIPMLAAGMSVGTIALATLIVNLRHAFYGLSLLDRFPKGTWVRWILVFGLTDETFSVLTTMPRGVGHRQMMLVTLLNQAWWVLGTIMGAVIGAQAQVSLAGLDFVLAALFAVLAVEQWRTRYSAAPLWIAIIAYGVAYAVSARHALLISIALSLTAGVILTARSTKSSEATP
ncbi:MAG: AzlC family ABC transporter permease [Burkholderiales bacterium]